MVDSNMQVSFFIQHLHFILSKGTRIAPSSGPKHKPSKKQAANRSLL
jgi:hypothetical protein